MFALSRWGRLYKPSGMWFLKCEVQSDKQKGEAKRGAKDGWSEATA